MFTHDPGTWSHVTEAMRSYWANEDRDILQSFNKKFRNHNISMPMKTTIRRHSTKNLFFKAFK